MTFVAGFAGQQNTNVVTTPFIDNFSMPLAATEYSYSFPSNTRRFTIKNRTSGLIKMAYISGTSGSKYYSLDPGTSYTETDIGSPVITMYLQSGSAGQVLEIISWS
jgi:hypothetical protein